MVLDSVQELFDFIERSPSCFHVIENAKKMLEKEGFEELSENKTWKLQDHRIQGSIQRVSLLPHRGKPQRFPNL